MKKVKIIDFKKKRRDRKEVNINKIKNFKMIGIILLIIFIMLLIFNNIKIYIEKKVLKKENKLLNKEKETSNNITNKYIQDREISEKYKFEKEYKLYSLLCPKEVIGKKKSTCWRTL